MNPNSNEFASKLSDAYTIRSNVSSIMNPKLRYTKAGSEAPRSVAGNPKKVNERDNRPQAPGNAASKEQSSGIRVPSNQSPVDPKPQNNLAANLDNAQTELRLEFNNETLLSGLIMSEVLGRPKCFGMHRRAARR